MPREARQKSESRIYHVMLRGINRQTIFEDEEDCEKFLQCLKDCKEISGFTLYAYSLMGNHVHLLIKENKETVAQIIKRIGARYVSWYNWKYKRSGHLFQDRFKSEAIEDDAQFLAVLRYIYQNPVKAKLCEDPADYRWGSYRLLSEDSQIVDNEQIVEIIPIDQLRSFVMESGEEQFIDLVPETRLSDREATELRNKVCKIKNITEFSGLQPEKQERYLRILYEKGCSIRQLARITGVTKGRVEKLLK